MAIQNSSKVAITSFGLFCAALLLTSYSSRNPWVSQVGVQAINEVLRPFQIVVQGGFDQVGGVWGEYFNLIGVKEENSLLRERLEALEAENSKLLEWESEITRLRTLLSTLQDHDLQGIAADVIGYDPSNWVRAITVNKGSAHGISAGMAVISGDAIVGQVIGVSLHTARVLLVTDHSSGVDALVQSSRARGVLQGLGRDNCELRYVIQEEEVALGDRVISSGMDGVFPKGLMLGVVSDVKKKADGMFQAIKVKPAAQLSKLESVLIVTESNVVKETPQLPVLAKPPTKDQKKAQP